MSSPYIDQFQRVLNDQGRPAGAVWEFYCPFDGCRGYPKRKFRVDPEFGGWNCRHCNQVVPGKTYKETCREGHGGTWREFVQMMGDDIELWPRGRQHVKRVLPLSLSKARSIWGHLVGLSTLLPEHRELLLARAVDPVRAGYTSASAEVWETLIALYGEDLIVRAGLAYRDDDTQRLRPTRCVQPGRILIPYWDNESGVSYFAGYCRCPAQRPEQSDEFYKAYHDQWVKCASPAGFQTQIYGRIPDHADYLVITEGQIKAEAGIQRGFPFIGLTGMGSMHREVATQCRYRKVQRAVILFDTQLDDQDLIDYEAEHLARALIRKRIPTFRGVLPLEPGEAKADVDSFLLHHETRGLVEVLVEAGRHPYVLARELPRIE